MAFANRSGVFNKPSLSGFSPIQCNTLLIAADIVSTFSLTTLSVSLRGGVGLFSMFHSRLPRIKEY